MKQKKVNAKEIDNNINLVIEQITNLSDRQTKHIQSLTRIGVALSSVTSLDRIFDLILDEAVAFTNSDAATIYKVSEDKAQLDFVVVYNKSLHLRMGVGHGPITWKSLPLFDCKGNSNLSHIAVNVFHKKRMLCFDDVYKTRDYDITGTKVIDAKNRYRSKSMLTIPLKDHENEVLGVLQVINAMDNDGKVIPFSNEHKIMLKSLASQAAIAMTNRKLINDLEVLLMQFMQSIAKGIERKSKYSSNHITRVALLADMLAGRISQEKAGKFRNTRFSESELKEISMSGLMHDVGKIVTPEYVMDKSTKLETITDRIHLISMRFELFKKALALFKIEHGEAELVKIASKWYPPKSISNWEELIATLDKDMAFLENSNLGEELLDKAAKQRIDRIRKINLSFENVEYYLLSEDEAENLKISSGTLSPAERMTMNEHALVTWEMLSDIKFPGKFKNVPLFASTHHEKLNGSGYPFGMKEKQLPLQSRILAISDIFEALTAVDRPYKKGNKLSEALKIMAACARDREVDPDLLDFMLDSGLYIDYAQKYMKPEQIDKINISTIKKIYGNRRKVKKIDYSCK
jgi:HD-GYP domain-containing protein (c-di-GMP phosphodiesterase class II)